MKVLDTHFVARLQEESSGDLVFEVGEGLGLLLCEARLQQGAQIDLLRSRLRVRLKFCEAFSAARLALLRVRTTTARAHTTRHDTTHNTARHDTTHDTRHDTTVRH